MKAWRGSAKANAGHTKPTVIKFKTRRANILDVVAALGVPFAASIACRSGKTAIDAASIAASACRKTKNWRRKTKIWRRKAKNWRRKAKNRSG